MLLSININVGDLILMLLYRIHLIQ